MFYNVLVFFPENTELYLPNKRARKRTFQPTDKICKEGEHFMVITLDIYLFNQTMIRSCCNRLRKQKKKQYLLRKFYNRIGGYQLSVAHRLSLHCDFPKLSFF